MDKYYNNFDYFNITNKDKGFENLIILKKFKTMLQTLSYTCCVCCAIMMLNYLVGGGYNKKDEKHIAKLMNCVPYTGTDLKDALAYFEREGQKYNFNVISSISYQKNKNGLCFPTFRKFKKFVIDMLNKGYPILVENVDYGGHYKVIIGYDSVDENYENDMLIFADPSDFNDGKRDGYSIFPADRFFNMWFDNHCLSEKYRLQPFIVLTKNTKKA